MRKKKFEVAIFNERVRKLLKEGSKHRDLNDDWADMHYIEVEAMDISAARARIEARYPADDGFVIDQVTRLNE